MQNKIIIVGATSGIGRRMAERYAEAGHLVGITGRRKELLDEIQQAYPGKIMTACFDVTGDDNIAQLEALVKAMNGLDILVISAGTGEPADSVSWAIDKITIATNVTGFTMIANWGFNYFVKQDHGQLVAISSVAAIRGGSHAPAYNASKSFQSSYCYGLSVKAGKLKKNISITCIEPGFVKTNMAKGDKLFWVVPVDKAARQIIMAIEKKKRRAYISHRWWLVAQVLRFIPHWLYKKVA